MIIIALCSLLIKQKNTYLLYFSEINLLLWKCNKEKWLNSEEKLHRTKMSITQCSSAEVTNGMQKLINSEILKLKL